jgi:Muramidase (flagellum-specific)
VTREAAADGSLLPVVQRFRAYADYASAFDDYVRLLRSPRYAGILGAGDDAAAFAAGLVRGGYATDPDYAAKLRLVAAQVRGLYGG